MNKENSFDKIWQSLDSQKKSLVITLSRLSKPVNLMFLSGLVQTEATELHRDLDCLVEIGLVTSTSLLEEQKELVALASQAAAVNDQALQRAREMIDAYNADPDPRQAWTDPRYALSPGFAAYVKAITD